MPDFQAVASALAARYDASQLTAPTGYMTIRVATAAAPNQLPPLPCVLVFPDNGSFDVGHGTRLGSHSYLIRFYYSQIGDLARDSVALNNWLTVLANQHLTNVQLGGTVVSTRLMSWRVGQMNYAGTDYSGLELTVEVATSEAWAATA